MAILPKVKLKALVNFPANVYGGIGIAVDRASGNFTIDLDYSEFAFQGSLPTGSNVLVWDPVSNVYTLVPPSSTGGISDAPSDSQTYGRNNAAWVQVASPLPATATPAANGVGAVGVSLNYAREDHVHPAGSTGSGDVTGPAGAVADNIATYNGVTGKIIKDSGLSAAAVSSAVRYDTPQTLTAAQQTIARQNIYAAPFDTAAYSGLQVNGNCDVSQPNGTTVVTNPSGGSSHTIDVWKLSSQNAAAVITSAQIPAASFPSPLPGYSNGVSLKATTAMTALVNGDNAALYNYIEGYRIARLAWGTANAQPITIAMRLFSTVAGVALLRVYNSAVSRGFHVDMPVAAGWNFLVATIPGDTTGVWATDNNRGIIVSVAAAGKEASPVTAGSWGTSILTQSTTSTNLLASNNNQIIITGLVVLPGIEAPSAARSALIMRPFDQELVTCKRYWQSNTANCDATAAAAGVPTPSLITYSTEMRANPTITFGTPSLAGNNTAVSSLSGSAKSITVYVNSAAAGRFYWVGPTISDARL